MFDPKYRDRSTLWFDSEYRDTSRFNRVFCDTFRFDSEQRDMLLFGSENPIRPLLACSVPGQLQDSKGIVSKQQNTGTEDPAEPSLGLVGGATVRCGLPQDSVETQGQTPVRGPNAAGACLFVWSSCEASGVMVEESVVRRDGLDKILR